MFLDISFSFKNGWLFSSIFGLLISMFFKCFDLFLFFVFSWFYFIFKSFPKGEWVNLVFFEILIQLEILISYIFATCLLILYCSFSYLILSSVVISSFYFLSKWFFLKHKWSSASIVQLNTKKTLLLFTVYKDSQSLGNQYMTID